MRRPNRFETFVAGTATALLVLAPLVGVGAASAAETVVSSEDFEDGTLDAPWQQNGGPTLSVVDDAGDGVLEVADRANDYDGVQTAPGTLEAGTTYTFSASVRLADGVAGDVGVRFVVNHSGDVYDWVGATTMNAAGWTTVSGTYAVPADATEPKVFIGTADLDPAAPYTYLVDDLSIVTPDDGGDPDPVPDPSALSTDFEEGLDGWSPRADANGPPEVTITSAEVHGGSQAALVSDRPSQGGGIGHDATGILVPGVTYQFDAWIKFAEGQPTDEVWLSLASTVGDTTSFATLGQFTGMSNSEWVQVTDSFTVTEADELFIYLETSYQGGDTGNTSDFVVDDIAVTVPETPVIQDLEPIKDTVEFPVGVAIDSRETTGAAAELLLRHFDQITAENHMKPEAWYDADRNFRTHPEAVALMDFARDNDLAVYGHTLVWHSQTPDWFFQDGAGEPLTDAPADQELLRDRMRDHIFAVAEALAADYGPFGSATNPVDAFDVVNEVVSDGSEFEDGLRRSEWYDVLGEEYIDLAFRYADEAFNDEFADAAADRPVTLFINDYNTEQAGKQQRMHELVERLLDREVPVDGVGHQFHVNLAMPVAALEAAIVSFQDLGLVQVVTELDVTTGTPVTEAKLIEQGYYFRDAFRVFREYADDLFAVTVWGLTDGRSWRSGSGDPLVFDDDLQAKPAYYGIVDDELPDRLRTADVFAGDVALGPAGAGTAATEALEWRQLPLHAIEDSAAFQLRWAPDHLTAYVTVDDASVEDSDGVEFDYAGQTVQFGRDGAGDVSGVVTERGDGYDVVVHLPLDPVVSEGDTLPLDVRVTDGGDTIAWNSPGALGTLTLVEPLSYLEVVRAGTAPAIDGDVDAVWDDANVVTTEKEVQGTDGAIATVRTLWRDNTLYVLAEVDDPTVDVSGSDPWTQDSVEIYVDAGNVKNDSYRYDDTQIRVSAENAVSFGTGDVAFQRDRVVTDAAMTDDGYLVEASISLLDAGGLGTFHGLDFQVNDAAGGERTAIRNWADPTGAGYQSPARWGVGRLVAGPEDAPQLALGVDTVRAGGTVDVELSGFGPGEQIRLLLDETGPAGLKFGRSAAAAPPELPVVLGAFTADDAGAASGTITIPATLAPGDYLVLAVVDDEVLASSPLLVTAAAPGMAVTGVDVGGLVLVALLVLTAGTLLLMRRRAGARSPASP